MPKRIPVFKPFLCKEEILAARKALELGWLGPGSYVKEFEESISKFLDIESSKVIAVNTGTSAVHMALSLFNLQPGDEVITPSLNNIGDFQSIKYFGATPVFVDVKEKCLTIDPSKVTSLIGKKTKAIISLDYASHLHKYESVRAIAKEYNVPIIHDAAHSFGSRNSNYEMVGSKSDIAIFSFDPVKNITCIDGGVIIAQEKEHADRLRNMRQLGQMQNQKKLYSNNRSFTYDVEDVGYRYHLANLHAAIGVEQLKKIKTIKKKKQLIFSNYLSGINNNNIILPPGLDGDILPFIFVIRVKNKRDEFIDYCNKKNIDTGIHWQPGHQFSYLKSCKFKDLSVTEKIGDEIVTIPMYPDLSKKEQNYIIDVINNFKT